MKLSKTAPNLPQFSHAFLCLISLILTHHVCQAEIIRYTSDKYCDRHSVDAVYHEKYKPITNNIFADMKEFVTRVLDLIADSLTTVMTELPDRDASSNEEKKVHAQFKGVKSAFSSKVRKAQRNITSSWEALLAANFDLLFDNGKSSLEDYANKTARLTDSYSEARKTLDATLSSFIEFVKSTIRDGLTGIRFASEAAVEKEKEEKKKDKAEGDTEDDARKDKSEGVAQDDTRKDKSKEDILREKMVEITKMIVPGFLKNLTVEVIEKKMDLSKSSGVKPENRDSVLDDVEFDMLMVRNRIRAIVQSDVPRDKGATDLARRSIYTYWADTSDEMYKEKIRSKKSTDSSHMTGRLYYRNLWNDEKQLMETLFNLMEIYP